jgi:hypothetical protein
MKYLIADVVAIICHLISDKDKLNFLSTCSELRQMLKFIEFSTPVNIVKIETLPFFDSFTNVLVKRIMINGNFKLPSKTKHLTYDRCKGRLLPVPKNLISLRWSTRQKLNIANISNSLCLLEIRYQKKHAKKIIRNLKNVEHLVIGCCNNVNFYEYYPINVQRLEWNNKKAPTLNKKWELKYFSIN